MHLKTLHARGTPSCGKNTLGILLQAHVERNRPDITVYRITRPSPFPEEYKLLPYYELLNDMLRIRTGRSWEYKNDTMLIFNETQLSFTYNNLWNNLIKNMPDSFESRNFFVLRVSSYGYPSAVAVTPAPGSSPVILSP